jgi:signal-transduction protein with cAMP-binding, CBS, and nucleotidyltransferase domain
MNKDLRDFLFKDPWMRAFFRGCEKREERIITQSFHISEVEDKELIIQKNSLVRNLLFVAKGSVIVCKDDGPNEVC